MFLRWADGRAWGRWGDVSLEAKAGMQLSVWRSPSPLAVCQRSRIPTKLSADLPSSQRTMWELGRKIIQERVHRILNLALAPSPALPTAAYLGPLWEKRSQNGPLSELCRRKTDKRQLRTALGSSGNSGLTAHPLWVPLQ